ncbi:hypothetical protein HDU79_011002 [Rhizoclosmatium sp. JEL0117]|nr:hypothetical protein HDU79_011002 [Rhizoclosmatium sp. JEL0117]
MQSTSPRRPSTHSTASEANTVGTLSTAFGGGGGGGGGSSVAADYARCRAQLAVLKKALVDEQASASDLSAQLRIKDQQLRDATQQLDLLSMHNDALTKRIDSLRKEKSSSSSSFLPRSLFGGSSVKKPPLSSTSSTHSTEDMDIVFEQMESKAIENADLKEQIKTLTTAHETLLQTLQTTESSMEAFKTSHSALTSQTQILSIQLQNSRESMETFKQSHMLRMRELSFVIEDWKACVTEVKGLGTQYVEVEELEKKLGAFLEGFKELSGLAEKVLGANSDPRRFDFLKEKPLYKPLHNPKNISFLNQIKICISEACKSQITALGQQTNQRRSVSSTTNSVDWDASLLNDLLDLDRAFTEFIDFTEKRSSTETNPKLSIQITILWQRISSIYSRLKSHWRYKCSMTAEPYLPAVSKLSSFLGPISASSAPVDPQTIQALYTLASNATTLSYSPPLQSSETQTVPPSSNSIAIQTCPTKTATVGTEPMPPQSVSQTTQTVQPPQISTSTQHSSTFNSRATSPLPLSRSSQTTQTLTASASTSRATSPHPHPLPQKSSLISTETQTAPVSASTSRATSPHPVENSSQLTQTPLVGVSDAPSQTSEPNLNEQGTQADSECRRERTCSETQTIVIVGTEIQTQTTNEAQEIETQTAFTEQLKESEVLSNGAIEAKAVNGGSVQELDELEETEQPGSPATPTTGGGKKKRKKNKKKGTATVSNAPTSSPNAIVIASIPSSLKVISSEPEPLPISNGIVHSLSPTATETQAAIPSPPPRTVSLHSKSPTPSPTHLHQCLQNEAEPEFLPQRTASLKSGSPVSFRSKLNQTFHVTSSASISSLTLPLPLLLTSTSTPQEIVVEKEGYLDTVWDMHRIKKLVEESRMNEAKALRYERLLKKELEKDGDIERSGTIE